MAFVRSSPAGIGHGAAATGGLLISHVVIIAALASSENG